MEIQKVSISINIGGDIVVISLMPYRNFLHNIYLRNTQICCK
jgi:hypothetical protein